MSRIIFTNLGIPIEIKDDDLLGQPYMRRDFLYVAGNSNKFWSIEPDDCRLDIWYGKTNTVGNTICKEFDSADLAKKEMEKLIKQKVSKGYVEQGVKKEKPQRFKIKAVTLLTDGQDGGFSANIYNNNQELVADQLEWQDLNPKSKEYKDKAKEILEGDDEYQNGYLGTTTIEIEVVNGVPRIVGHIHIHGGQ